VKRILVPLDGTKNAETAISSLGQFCGPGDEVILLKVEKPQAPQRAGFRPSEPVMELITGAAVGVASPIPPEVPYYLETGDQTLQRQLDEAKDYLEGLAGALRASGQEVQTEVLISDDPDDAIVDYAREIKPTFIAMLRRTHPGLSEIIFGSVATTVMRADVAPVLFVPPRE
jgi:nucleotide-binding universal stress UspA family protein